MDDARLLIDVNNLMHRYFYAMKRDAKAAVLRFLAGIDALKDQFNTTEVVFCFDSKHSLRKKLYPEYKAGRIKNETEEQAETRSELYAQIDALRKDYLWDIGYRNILHIKGYEADDLIATQCEFEELCDSVTLNWIVSTDQDLWQLLCYNVRIHNPATKQNMTYLDFKKEWGVHPSQWWQVKAIAGCATDNIKGVPGVGEKTAAKYLRGELTNGPKHKAITEFDRTMNASLVQLPFPGCVAFDYEPDHISKTGRGKVEAKLMGVLRPKLTRIRSR